MSNSQISKQFENEARAQGYAVVAGMDEVGRGPLAGPVLACCVILKPDAELPGVNDSKKISEKKREQLVDVIRENALAIGIGACSSKEIDEKGIVPATYRAMALAVSQMQIKPDIVLVDGYPIAGEFAELGIEQRAIVKGDQLSLSIAAASIVAKVTRDTLMCEYAKTYPEYDFDGHKGYGTPKHIAAIKEHGACDLHRASFITNILAK